MDSSDKYIGQLLDNRYEILEKIGTGGMAVVYKARCHRLNRLVAVKILKDEFADDAEFKRRFHTESQAVAMLSHPNIVSIYDVSRTGNVEYIVMELIEGITLKQYINRKGQLNWKEALHFATQITKALSHAHSRGIIHRDIKPQNIMILKDGSVKVADFGIARLLSTQNTLTQDALGSVHYISPEQAKGSHVDARSDIYSVGVVMYEMLTSRLPFVGDSAVSIAIQHISAIPLMPREINPDIPAGLESITMHAMEPDMNRRYASADELLRDLEEFRKNPGIDFNYSADDGGEKSDGDSEVTRELPTNAILKAETSLSRSQRFNKKNDLPHAEKQKKRKKTSRTTVLIGIAGIAVFLIVIFAFMWNFFLKDMFSHEGQTVKIPNFVGQEYSKVVNDTNNQKVYNFVPTYQYSGDYNNGIIMHQDPPADRQQAVTNSKIEVDVTVSQGKEPDQTMPDVTNMDYREAENELNKLNLNLTYKETQQPDDSTTEKYVISTIPKVGAPLPKGSTVFITYSSGPEVKKTVVPKVTSLSLSEAILRLQDSNLSYNDPQYIDNDAPKNTVVFQSIEEGTQVNEHTKITLQVSNGPASTVSPPPTVSPPVQSAPGTEPGSQASPSSTVTSKG